MAVSRARLVNWLPCLVILTYILLVSVEDFMRGFGRIDADLRGMDGQRV